MLGVYTYACTNFPYAMHANASSDWAILLALCFILFYKMSFSGLNSVLHACKASTLVTEPSPQTLFSHLWPPLVLLSLGRRLETSLGLLLELSQRQGVERLWEIVTNSQTLGHLSYVDFYGLIYDQANCTIWSLLPAKIQLGTKTNLLSESL